jgi:EAL domain-containing protein (putative c-di-GMP-specific phosphodiesterase class I)
MPDKQHAHHNRLAVNVNLSPRQLRQPDLVASVAAVLDETGLDPGYLVLEITESVMMEQAASTIEVLRELKALGVRLAIDDFGTGYSSLAYLKAFPLDFLKIDRKFVAGIDKDASDNVIIGSMISLAHALNLTVVAEGAETAGEVDQLHNMGLRSRTGILLRQADESRSRSGFLSRIYSTKTRNAAEYPGAKRLRTQ